MLRLRRTLFLEADKLKSYLGFSIKSGKAIFGLDSLCEYTKVVRLVIVCSTVSDNSLKKVSELCEYKKWKMVQLNDDLVLGTLISRENCKIIGLTDKNLSSAVLELGGLFHYNN